MDVNEGYKAAYGGKERVGAIEILEEDRRSPPPLKTNFTPVEVRKMKMSVDYSGEPIAYGNSSEAENGTGIFDDGTGGLVILGESAKGRDGSVAREIEIKEDRGPHLRGPMTPNGFEDITPVTKGEWCFLMVGEGWKEARTVAVETC